MPNPATALQTLTPIVEQRTVVDGYVSTLQPAPVSFSDRLFVIVPQYSPDVPVGPCDWGAIHGNALPAQGAKVVIVFDEREVPVIVWWEGTFSSPDGWEPGDYKWSARATAGAEWLGPCKGQAVSRATYAALFAETGVTYGEGDKATTFNLPNGEERVLMGAGGTHALGSNGGEAKVKLTTAQLASHSHQLQRNNVQANSGGTGAIYQIEANSGSAAGGPHPETQGVGSGEAHENLQPFVAANLFIHI